jgi:AbrB family looped-hinge helix DNA binding protein
MNSAIVMNVKATLSSKGQVVIPRPLREALGLHAGSELVFEMHKNGVLEVKPLKRTIESFLGRCKRSGKQPLSIEDMDEAIGRAVINNDKATKE